MGEKFFRNILPERVVAIRQEKVLTGNYCPLLIEAWIKSIDPEETSRLLF